MYDGGNSGNSGYLNDEIIFLIFFILNEYHKYWNI